MYKFQPILKSTIWGGEKIVPYKHIASDQKQVGESWELSGVKGNESVVAGGPEAGTTLPGLIARHGAALLGKANAARFGQEFPLLIKFIDARQDLSIQVHPNDALAWERHKSKGKTEMWYVVDAEQRRTPALGIRQAGDACPVRSQRRGQHHHRPARRI